MNVFLRPNKPQPIEPAAQTTVEESCERDRRLVLEQWRRCEQLVTQAWKAWQAADHHEHGRCYRNLMAALAEEERAAAEIERQALSST